MPREPKALVATHHSGMHLTLQRRSKISRKARVTQPLAPRLIAAENRQPDSLRIGRRNRILAAREDD